MYEREKEIVTELLLTDSKCYNIALGGHGGSMKQNQKPFRGRHSDSTKKKLSESSLKWASENENPFKGKKHSLETRKLISKNTSIAMSGKRKTESHKKNLAESLSMKAKTGKSFVFVNSKGDKEYIDCLKAWCVYNNLEYTKVYCYINKGKIKMIERFRSPTREWFVGCSLSIN
jgi:hypothetical protein